MECLLDVNKVIRGNRKDFEGSDAKVIQDLEDLMHKVNAELGNYVSGLGDEDRRSREKTCVYCDRFEGDVDLKTGASFLECRQCQSVHYCCEVHQKADAEAHAAVCRHFKNMQRRNAQTVRVKYDTRHAGASAQEKA